MVQELHCKLPIDLYRTLGGNQVRCTYLAMLAQSEKPTESAVVLQLRHNLFGSAASWVTGETLYQPLTMPYDPSQPRRKCSCTINTFVHVCKSYLPKWPVDADTISEIEVMGKYTTLMIKLWQVSGGRLSATKMSSAFVNFHRVPKQEATVFARTLCSTSTNVANKAKWCSKEMPHQDKKTRSLIIAYRQACPGPSSKAPSFGKVKKILKRMRSNSSAMTSPASQDSVLDTSPSAEAKRTTILPETIKEKKREEKEPSSPKLTSKAMLVVKQDCR